MPTYRVTRQSINVVATNPEQAASKAHKALSFPGTSVTYDVEEYVKSTSPLFVDRRTVYLDDVPEPT